MICYITTNLNRSFIIVYITFVSYTDIEIEFEPSDEESTDSVGKLKKIHFAKYIMLIFIADVNALIKLGHVYTKATVSGFSIYHWPNKKQFVYVDHAS